MAFLLPYEGAALGGAALEGLAGIVAGLVYAVETHHKHGSNNDSGAAPDDDDHDPGDTGVPDDPPGGICYDTDSYVQHSDVMDVSHANEVGSGWSTYQIKKVKRGLRHGYYNFPEYLAYAVKRGVSAAAAYSAYRNLIRTIREQRDGMVQHTPIIDRRRRALTAGLAGAAGVPRNVVRGLFSRH